MKKDIFDKARIAWSKTEAAVPYLRIGIADIVDSEFRKCNETMGEIFEHLNEQDLAKYYALSAAITCRIDCEGDKYNNLEEAIKAIINGMKLSEVNGKWGSDLNKVPSHIILYAITNQLVEVNHIRVAVSVDNDILEVKEVIDKCFFRNGGKFE